MNFFKRLMAKDKDKEPKKVKSSPFTIEYYPLTKRYYPKYKESYLYYDPLTGIFELDEFMTYAKYSQTESGAEAVINEFKEQRFKENVIVIQK